MKKSPRLPSLLAWTSSLLFALAPFAHLSAGTGTDPNVANFEALASVDFTDPMVNGTYQGLLFDLNEAPAPDTALTLKVSSKGGFSGTLNSAFGKNSLRGTFASDGTASATVKSGDLISYVHLVIVPESGSGMYRVAAKLGASPDGTNPTLVGELHRPIYSKSFPNPHAGSYTIVIPAPTLGPEDPPSPGQPTGDGHLLGMLMSDGKATLRGRTSDGQTLKWSGNLLEGDMLSFFSGFAKKDGFAIGDIFIRDSSRSDLDGELSISRKFSGGTSASYGFISDAYGSLYLRVPYPLLPIFADFTTAADNSILGFDAGPFSGQEVVTTWATNNRLSTPKTQTRSMSGGINSKSGQLSVNYNFNDPALSYSSTKSRLEGVILQKSGEVRGSYIVGAGVSGRVELLPNYAGLSAPVNIITPRSESIGPQGGSYIIYITSSEPWGTSISYDFSPLGGANNWLQLAPQSGSGDGIVRVTVAANPNFFPRSAKIEIAGRTHSITQKQAIYQIGSPGSGTGGTDDASRVTISPTSRVVSTFSQQFEVLVSNYDPANSTNPDADFLSPVNWASVIYAPGEPDADGVPQGVATVLVEFNPFFFTRRATLRIGGVPFLLTQLW